jgi:protocatechuate 3,4-dioxygenase beta subunit
MLIFALFTSATILFALPAQAQTPKKNGATFTGTVLDATGRPVRGASVTCETSSGTRPRAVHTDSKGKFFITGLKTESYDLRAYANGAYSDWERNIPMSKTQTKEITLQLLNGNTKLSGIQPAKRQH